MHLTIKFMTDWSKSSLNFLDVTVSNKSNSLKVRSDSL